MSDIESERIWVENCIHEIASDLSVVVDALEWPRLNDPAIVKDWMANVVSIKLWRDGKSEIIKFTTSELDDVETSLELQTRLSGRIRDKLDQDKTASGSTSGRDSTS